MSSLTSFDALHEPPSQNEDPPENVLSKIFQRVKSTLSTSSTPPTSGTPPSTLPAGISAKNTLSSVTSAPSLSSRNHATTSSSSVGGYQPSSAMASTTVPPAPSTAASSIASDQTIRALEQSSTSSTASTASSSPPTLSDIGSWGVSSDGKSGNNGTQLDTQTGLITSNTITRKMEEKDRPPVVRRNTNNLNAPKRASSLFKVSTVDHSIVQDDDSASLSSLAPPVVSLSPAFGDQRTAKDKSLEVSGAMVIRNTDSRMSDPSRLSVSK